LKTVEGSSCCDSLKKLLWKFYSFFICNLIAHGTLQFSILFRRYLCSSANMLFLE
jgi:hypothetical protein